MRHLRVFLAGLATVLAASQASALVEFRVGYGTSNGSPQTFNAGLDATCTTTCGNLKTANGLGFDAIFSPPLIPFGIGLRYETLAGNVSIVGSGGANSFKYNYQRTALLLNYRLIDTLMYVGPIVTYGLSNKGTVKVEGSSSSDWTAGSNTSYSVGLEAGMKLLVFNIGAEVGYSHMGASDIKDSNGNFVTVAGSRMDNVPMTGSYMKAVIGFGF